MSVNKTNILHRTCRPTMMYGLYHHCYSNSPYNKIIIDFHGGKYYQLSHGCQGDTEKYLIRGNLYHPRHTCITRDVVEGNTSVVFLSNFLEKFSGRIKFLYNLTF